MEIFRPATLLKKVLFPTLGRPTRAIKGFAMRITSLLCVFDLLFIIPFFRAFVKKKGGDYRRKPLFPCFILWLFLYLGLYLGLSKSRFLSAKGLKRGHLGYNKHMKKPMKNTFFRKEKFLALVRFVKNKYDLLAEKKYTTIAGTLVFFLIMSIVPLGFWLTLLFGKLELDAESFLSSPAFDSVRNILLYIREEAAGAAAGASVFLIGTTLYSATNLFYHMRRSGEIIYEYRRKKHGALVRLGALIQLFFVMFSVALSAALLAGGSFLFSRLFSFWLQTLLDDSLTFVVSFFLVWLLNGYICPYKVKARELIFGTVTTVAAWAAALIGFKIYLRFGNLNKLYGALSAVIAFMLWLYILMICFVAGVIFNSDKIVARESKKL
jgi:uncharacterized BrkB/YihY/UPF0761 family membrane protein